MKKILLPLIIVLAIFGLAGWWLYSFYQTTISAPQDSPSGEYIVRVESGDNLASISDQLVKDNIISNKAYFLWLANNRPTFKLQVKEYTLQVPAEPEDILSQIQNQSENSNPNTSNIVKITLKEGKTADDVIAELVANNLGDTESWQAYLQDPENFDRQTYPFLPEPLDCEYGDPFSCQLYYLEGYLYPDTYEFFQDATKEDITAKILRNFQTKVWNKLNQEEKSNLNQAIIMASVIEKETGRPIQGVNQSNIQAVNLERAKVARVFYNRNTIDRPWQSDVTVQYSTGRKLCQQTFEIPDCFYLSDPIAKHKYSTYANSGYPIGAISSPQIDNISAALNPASGDYLYFVADLNGVTYFANTETEHRSNIQKAIQINNSLE